MQIRVEQQGTSPAGAPVHMFYLDGEALRVVLCSYGARITAVETQDREGVWEHVALGSAVADAYYGTPNLYIGCTVGRVANRLAGGSFVLDGREFQITQNIPPNSLHGGVEGFDSRVWAWELLEDGVKFTLVSPDGDQGYPGELRVSVLFTIAGNELRMEYEARSSADTVINLTSHAYWNLTGKPGMDVGNHVIALHASAFTPTDADSIPTGEIAPVEGTVLDLRAGRRVADGWDSELEQIRMAAGYDHNFVVDGEADTLRLCAVVKEPASGRVMEVLTTEPGVQFYTGNYLNHSFVGRGGPLVRREGFCLETQHFPDAPHHAGFPSTRLNKGEIFQSVTLHRFSVQ